MKFIYSIFIFLILLSSCANIVAPSGGVKDINPPKVLNKKISEKQGITNISFTFDEYIQINKWEEYFYVSPPLEKRIEKNVKGKSLTISIKDTLTKNTTYNIVLSNCIKDNNEGNILDSLFINLSTSNKIDSFTLRGKLQNAYTLAEIENAWIMLFEENRSDSVVFKETPNYVAKTNKKGDFYFPNLNNKNFKVVSLTDFDFIYNKEEEIAFLNTMVNAEKDSFISLLSFDPIIVIDSLIKDTSIIKVDSIEVDSLDKNEMKYGTLNIIIGENKQCLFQLFQNNKVVNEFSFSEKPFLITNITPGKYRLKYINDLDRDEKWTTGDWNLKTQPEKTINYPSEIIIRANWDLELEWDLY